MPENFEFIIGDNDGFGQGILDGGDTSSFAIAGTDNRSEEESTSTLGAQYTDTYSALYPFFGPNTTEIGDVVFTFEGEIVSATFEVDVADLQPTVFGETLVYFNGELQTGAFDVDQGFQNSGILTFNLDLDDIARANSAGEFVVTIDHGANSSFDYIAFDYFRLSGLIENQQPEEQLFEFNVYTSMQLARAAYILSSDSSTTEGPVTQQFLELQTDLRQELANLEATYSDFSVVREFSIGDELIIDSDGLYVNENAAALISRTDDALIISFRGTNDNEDTYSNIVETLLPRLSSAADQAGPQYTGPFAALNGIQRTQGNGRGVENALDRIIDSGVPEDIESPDVEHWFDLEAHWELFDDLIAAIPELLSTYGLEEVQFTGHSLGGAMVQWAMHTTKEASNADIYSAYSFAAPGRDVIGISVEDDPRLLNVAFENDPVYQANFATNRIGDLLEINTEGTGSHDTEDYLFAAKTLLEAGFVTGDRLDNPEEPGTPIGPQVENLVFNLDASGDFFLFDTAEDAVLGTSGDDEINVSADLFRSQGFIVAGLEGDDDIEVSGNPDIIVFRDGDNHDTVSDFAPAEDRVALYGFEDPMDFQFVVINGLFTDDVTLVWNDNSSLTFESVVSESFFANLDEILIAAPDDSLLV